MAALLADNDQPTCIAFVNGTDQIRPARTSAFHFTSSACISFSASQEDTSVHRYVERLSVRNWWRLRERLAPLWIKLDALERVSECTCKAVVPSQMTGCGRENGSEPLSECPLLLHRSASSSPSGRSSLKHGSPAQQGRGHGQRAPGAWSQEWERPPGRPHEGAHLTASTPSSLSLES